MRGNDEYSDNGANVLDIDFIENSNNMILIIDNLGIYQWVNKNSSLNKVRIYNNIF